MDKTVKICGASELAEIKTQQIMREDRAVNVIKRNSFGENKGFRRDMGTKENGKTKMIQCTSCGSKYFVKQCPAFKNMCNKCKKYHHYAKMCRTKNIAVLQGRRET